MSKYIILLITIVSCSSGPYVLTDKTRGVEILKRAPKDQADCEVLAKVKGFHKEGSADMATNMARNAAADMGADSIFIDDVVANGGKREIFATAYKCN